ARIMDPETGKFMTKAKREALGLTQGPAGTHSRTVNPGPRVSDMSRNQQAWTSGRKAGRGAFAATAAMPGKVAARAGATAVGQAAKGAKDVAATFLMIFSTYLISGIKKLGGPITKAVSAVVGGGKFSAGAAGVR